MYPSQNANGECFDWFSVKYTPPKTHRLVIGLVAGQVGRADQKKKV